MGIDKAGIWNIHKAMSIQLIVGCNFWIKGCQVSPPILPCVATWCHCVSQISQPFSVLAYWEQSNTGSDKHHETELVASLSLSTQKWTLHTSASSTSLLQSWSTLQFWWEGQRDGGRWGMENGKKKREWRGSGEASLWTSWWWTASKLGYVHIHYLALTKETLCVNVPTLEEAGHNTNKHTIML